MRHANTAAAAKRSPRRVPLKKSADLKKGDGAVAGVRLSHPEKILDASSKLTKRDLALYFEKVAPLMLPFVAERPLMFVRCPAGQGRSCFFQKHSTPGSPRELKSIRIPGDDERGLALSNASGLVSLAQLGVLELHTWGSSAAKIENPDLFVLDLDPDPDLPWKEVVRAAEELRTILKEMGLESFPKLSGGKGIHVVVPLDGKSSWSEVKDFTHSIAQTFEEHDPQRYVSTATKARRKGRIFIDYLRNARGATAVAPYSPRAKPGAPVAMPLTWVDLKKSRGSQDFTVAALLKAPRISAPWKNFWKKRQRLPS